MLLIVSDRVGVKRIASTWAGECPQAKFSEDKLEGFVQIHDRIKHEIKEELERQGFKCDEEYPVEHEMPDGNRRILGKVDLYCVKGGFNVIIEVKSSIIGNGKPRDMMQLYLYHYLMAHRGTNINAALLVYKNYVNTNSRVIVPLGEGVNVSLPNKFVYVKLRIDDAAKQVLRLEELVRELVVSGYVIGMDCEYCVNNACPLIRIQKPGK